MTYLKKMAACVLPAVVLAAALTTSPNRAEAGPDPLLGEIMLVGFNFCPRGWAAADGQILQINSNQALYSLIGTIYGGDGRTTFALPDLRGRVVMGQGQGPGLSQRDTGQRFGAASATLNVANLSAHSHLVNVTNVEGDQGGPGGKILAAGHGDETIYTDNLTNVNRTMAPGMIGNTGGGQPFNIQDPYLGLLHCIALQGQFPSRN